MNIIPSDIPLLEFFWTLCQTYVSALESIGNQTGAGPSLFTWNVGQNPLRTKPHRTTPPDKTPSLFCMGRTKPSAPHPNKGTDIIHHTSVKNIL